MKTFSTVVRVVTLGMLIAVFGTAAAQQSYPSKPIRLIIPYPPGGSTDPVARLVGQKLTEIWGQQVFVDSRPGGNTVIGTDALAKSAPDGYTLLLTTNAIVILPHLIASLPYDSVNDLAPVATLIGSEYVLALYPGVPANNLQELIALAKSKPSELNYASSGSGSLGHLAAELFNMMAGVKIQHIPYKGGGLSFVDLIGGQVQLAFNNPIIIIPHIKTGKLKAIAISGEARSPLLPQVQTFAEAGLLGFSAKNWFGIIAPGATPKGIINKLSTEIGRILTMPELKEALAKQGMDPFVSTPEQFAALMKADSARYGKVIRAANIKIE